MQLIVAEKPSVHKNIGLALGVIEAEGLSNVHLFYKFEYTNYTFPSHPLYQHDVNTKFKYRVTNYSGGVVKDGADFNFHEATHNDFVKYSEICLFLEEDHSAIRAADLFLDHVFGNNKASYPVTFTLASCYDVKEIKDKYENRLDYFTVQQDPSRNASIYAVVERFRRKYQIKDYIDFNFNALMMKHIHDGKELMTRNKIMTLLLLNKFGFRDGMQANQTIYSEMVYNNIGSPASISEIIQSLIKDNLISKEVLKVTKKGKAFIDILPAEMKVFDNLLELQRIASVSHRTYSDKLIAAEQHLVKLFSPYLNKD